MFLPSYIGIISYTMIRIPINQPVFQWFKYPRVFFVAQLRFREIPGYFSEIQVGEKLYLKVKIDFTDTKKVG